MTTEEKNIMRKKVTQLYFDAEYYSKLCRLTKNDKYYTQKWLSARERLDTADSIVYALSNKVAVEKYLDIDFKKIAASAREEATWYYNACLCLA